MQRYDMFIGGESHPPSTEHWFPTDNPCLGTPWAGTAEGGPGNIGTAVHTAHRTLHTGPRAAWTASARGAPLHRLGDTVAAHARAPAETKVRDNGKLFTKRELRLAHPLRRRRRGRSDRDVPRAAPWKSPDTSSRRQTRNPVRTPATRERKGADHPVLPVSPPAPAFGLAIQPSASPSAAPSPSTPTPRIRRSTW
jgi:hypothetical protein